MNWEYSAGQNAGQMADFQLCEQPSNPEKHHKKEVLVKVNRSFEIIRNMHGVEKPAYWPADNRQEKQIPPTIQFRFAAPLTPLQVKTAAESAGLKHSHRTNTSTVKAENFRIHVTHKKKPLIQIQANEMTGELAQRGRIMEFLYALPIMSRRNKLWEKLLNALRKRS